MKNKLCLGVIVALHFVSCTPDQYVQLDAVPRQDTGYAIMRKVQIIYSNEFDTLACIRNYSLEDTTYWETGCIDNRLTPKIGDSKDTIYQTYPWPLVRFIVDKSAVKRLDICGKR